MEVSGDGWWIDIPSVAWPLLAPVSSRALGADDETRTLGSSRRENRSMRLWHVFAVACVAADLDVRPAGDLSTASRKRLGGKTRAALGLGFGFAVVPRHAQELYSQFKPRTAEAWRKSMNQRRAIVPLQERAPSILAVAFTCSVLMVHPHARIRTLAPSSSHRGERAAAPDSPFAPAECGALVCIAGLRSTRARARHARCGAAHRSSEGGGGWLQLLLANGRARRCRAASSPELDGTASAQASLGGRWGRGITLGHP